MIGAVLRSYTIMEFFIEVLLYSYIIKIQEK